jgi:signal transduction histidine kinase
MTRTRLDALLAAALFAAALLGLVFSSDGISPLGAALASLYTLPLAVRTSRPLLALGLVVTGVALMVAFDAPASVVLIPALALASYSAGRALDPPWSHVAAAVAVGWLWLAYVVLGDAPVADLVVGTMIYGGAWWVGRALRSRQQHAEHLAELVAHGERERRDSEQRAVAAERTRIARELHDIVSHSISVISVQAEGVRRRLHPEQVREAERLQDIETSARHAMVELRRLLGVLREEGEAPLAPQPGLDQLPRLVERTQAAGLPVELSVEGRARPLPAAVDLTAYRIVQEALTNALRHAGPATATVRITHGRDELCVQVEDTGDGADGYVNGNGSGLVGMRERVALFGGDIEVGEREGGGFRVAATLPLRLEASR